MICRLSSELCEFFFFKTFNEQTLGKQYRQDRYNAGKSQSEKVSCSMSCNCYLTSKRFLKRGFNFAHELLWTTHVRQPKDLRRNKSILIILPTQGKKHIEGGVRVCGIAVLGYFWCGFAVIFISKYGIAVIFISKYGIAVFKVQAVCDNFKFYVAVIGEKLLSRGDLLPESFPF